MKAKVSKGASFRGCLDYVTGKNGAERIGGTLAGKDAREMSREMAVARRLREDITRPVWHASLSLPKGERLDTERWNKACVAFLARMGIIPPEEVQWTAWRHTDGEYDHVHIVVNRISLTGAVWDAGLDVYKAIAATREIEKSFGLTITPGRENKKFAEPSLKRGEVEKAIREQRPPVKVRVSDAVKIAIEGKPDVQTFVQRLEECGVGAVPNISESTLRMNGFSFLCDGIAVKGSDVGASWKHLKEMISYGDIQRDGEFLLDLKRRTAGTEKSCGTDSFNPHGYDGDVEADRRKRAEGDRSTDRSGIEGSAKMGESLIYPVAGVQRGFASDGRAVEGAGTEPPLVCPLDAGGVDEWADTADTLSAIAGYQRAFVSPDTDVRKVKEMQGWERLKRIKALPTESLQIKMGKVLDELTSLGCPEYRITAVVPKDLTGGFDSKGKKLYSKNLCRESKDADEVFFKQGEEEKWLSKAEDFNDEQRDIYVTPIDPKYYYLIVDDLNDKKLEQMKSAGVTPCIVVESSQGNYHAIVKIEKTGADEEKACADALVKELNREFEGDLKISGSEHMFRLSGFQSRKPSRNGWRVRLAEVHPGAVCKKTSERLQKMMEERNRKKKESIIETKPKERTAARIAADISSFSDMERRYREEWETTLRVFRQKKWKEDWSQIDFKTAKTLLIEGYDREDIVRAMVAASPDVQRRHPNTEAWARGVVESADRSIPDDLRPSRYDGR